MKNLIFFKIFLLCSAVISLICPVCFVLGTADPNSAAKPQTDANKPALYIWHTEADPLTITAMEEIMNDFEKLHPQIDMQQVVLKWIDLEQRLIKAIAAGGLPDIAHAQAVTCAALCRKNILRPLDDIVKSVGEDNIWEGLKHIGFYDGHYYGLGHAAGTSLLIYRKDLLDQKGLQAPQTWGQFIDVSQKLTEDTNSDGQIDRYALLIPGDKLFLNIAIGELVKSNGGRLFDEQGMPTLCEKQVIETLDFLRNISKYMPPDWPSYEYANTFKALAEGKVAMIYLGYGRGVNFIKKYAPPQIADVNHFSVTIKPHGPSAVQSGVQVDAEQWMIFKDSKNIDMAVEFLKFFYKNENYIKYVETVPLHLFPMTKSLRKSDDYQNIEMIKNWRQWVDVQEYYFSRDLVKPTLIIDWSDLSKFPFLMEVMESGILSDMVLEVAYKQVEPQIAAKQAQEKLTNFLKTIK